ncbi:MAG: hypothetical protein ACTSWY_13060 [Promethearchaeota archaeon]
MVHKKKVMYKGFLIAKNMNKEIIDDNLAEYWRNIKDNLFILGDFDNQKITFLNRELKKIASKFEGTRIQITIEPYNGEKNKGLPDPNKEYKGYEKFKRTVFSMFKLT